MQLPKIDSLAVQRSDPTAITDPAQRRAAKVFSEGLAEIGKELIRSEQAKASADFSTRLQEIDNKIASNTTVNTQFVRDNLGGSLDGLPPEIRSRVTQRMFDVTTGQEYDADREDIPMYAVAGHIFDAQARSALAAASQNIGEAGWQAAFQDSMQGHIAERRAKIGHEQIQAAVKGIAVRDTESALQMAGAGDPLGARKTITESRALTPAEKEKAFKEVERVTDSKEIYDALRKEDYAEQAALVGRLNDPAQFTSFEPKEREAFSERLKASMRSFQTAAEQARKERVRAIDDAGWNTIFTAQRAGQPVTLDMIPPPGLGSTEQQKEMIAYVEKLNKGEKPETNWAVYAGLVEMAAKQKDRFLKTNLLSYRNQLADAEFKHLLDAQMSGKGDPNGKAGDYDKFVSTEEAVNYRLLGYNIDPNDKGETTRQRVGYLKTVIQHELAAEQAANQGNPLDVERRDAVIDRVLKREIKPKSGWLSSSDAPAQKAGVPASTAAAFQRAVQALDPAGMADPKNREATLKKHYDTFTAYEPAIEVAWQVQAGSAVRPDTSIRAWQYLQTNWGRLESRLRATGGWTDNEDLRKKRLVQMAVQELVAMGAK